MLVTLLVNTYITRQRYLFLYQVDNWATIDCVSIIREKKIIVVRIKNASKKVRNNFGIQILLFSFFINISKNTYLKKNFIINSKLILISILVFLFISQINILSHIFNKLIKFEIILFIHDSAKHCVIVMFSNGNLNWRFTIIFLTRFLKF